MKLVTYWKTEHPPRLGAVVNDYVFDLAAMSAALTEIPALPSDILEFLAIGEVGLSIAQTALDRALALNWPGIPLTEVILLAPVPRPAKILCLAGNYQAHIQEGGGKAVNKTQVTPRVFVKPVTTIIGHGQPIRLPQFSQTIDYELELAVIIGRLGHNLSISQVTGHIAGYTIFNDISARSLTIAEGRQPRNGDSFFDWLNGKWFDTFGPMGPYLVTKDEVPDPQNLSMRLWVNDELRQDGNTNQMIFNVAETISFISKLVTLEPGDVIATGTPAGVGATTNAYLQAGDRIVGEIEDLGRLQNWVQGNE